MAENNAPQNLQDDELSVDELDAVAGGSEEFDDTNSTCPTTNNGCNFVAGCGGKG